MLAIACGGGGDNGSYVYNAPQPMVTRVQPSQGYPGDEITIEGGNLTGATQITFGGVDAAIFRAGPGGSLVATVPEGAGSGPVSVRTHAGTAASSAPFTALPVPAEPTITGWTPDFGGPGTLVTLEGTGFSQARGVYFGWKPAEEFKVLSDTRMTVRIPDGATTGPITVLLPAWVAGDSTTSFPVVPPPPAVAGFDPASAPPGEFVNIIGAWNGTVTDVAFSNHVSVPFTTNADGSLRVQVPANAATGPITVTSDPGGAGASPAAFTVLQEAPGIRGVNPGFGGPGDIVTITGSNLGQILLVMFGERTAAFTVADDGHSIQATVPMGATSGPIYMLGTDGLVRSNALLFTVSTPPAKVTGTDVPHALPGDSVHILGSYLGQTREVRLGGVIAKHKIIDPSTIQAFVPPGVKLGEWVVTGPGGSLTVPGQFAVDPLPPVTVSGISPATGFPDDEVILRGTNLAGVDFVMFGETKANESSRTPWLEDGTEFRFFIPRHAQASAPIHVHSLDGTVTTLPASAFALQPSRTSVSQKPLRVDAKGSVPLLNYPVNARRSNLQAIDAPRSTIFHAFDLNGNGAGLRASQPRPAWILDLALDPCFYPALPADLRTQLEDVLHVPRERVDISVNSQNYPFDGTTPGFGVWLMRPHYWADAGAPYRGTYSDSHELQAGIFDADVDLTFTPNGNGANAPQVSGAVHPISITTGPDSQGFIRPGGNTEAMAGFDPTRTTGFWTLVVKGSGTSIRAEACLHLFLNDEIHADLAKRALDMSTLFSVMRWATVPTSPLAGTRARTLLASLWRPLGDAGRSTSALSADGTQIDVTIRGTGLTGVRKAHCHPSDTILQVQPKSDAIMDFAVPLGTTGVTLVAPDTGASDLIAIRQP